MPKTEIYLRCADGHWFRADSRGACPIDGWFFGNLETEVRSALAAVEQTGQTPTLDLLRRSGMPAAALDTCIVVEASEGAGPPELFEATRFDVAVPPRRKMDRGEFIRRVKVHLDVDFPGLANNDGIAAALGVRLFQYVRQPPQEGEGDSPTLRSLLQDAPALLFFSAGWDGSAPDYRAVVEKVAVALGIRIVDIDIDDSVGSAVAHLQRVVSIPCVIGTWNPNLRVLGVRGEQELIELFSRIDRP